MSIRNEWVETARYRLEEAQRWLRDHLPPRTLPEAAFRGDNRKVRQLLAGGADVNAPDTYGSCALVYAAAQGHLETIRLLLEAGAWVDGIPADVTGQEIWTPLMAAVSGSVDGETEVVRLLLAHGANVNLVDRFGDTALLLADLASQIKVACLLLEAGADVNVADKRGRTALIKASAWMGLALPTLLLGHGADRDAQNEKGQTPLMLAIEYLNVDVVKLLLAHGADVSIRDADGRTALEYAQSNTSMGYPLREGFWDPVITLIAEAENRKQEIT